MKVLLLSVLLIGYVAAQGGRLDPRCPINEDSRRPTQLPHPTDCSQFLKCNQGRTFEVSCPRGQHWNARLNFCDSVENARCMVQPPQFPVQPPIRPQSPVVRPRPQPIPQPDMSWGIAAPAEIDHPDYLFCPLNDFPGNVIYFPYHMNCDHFYQCVSGRAVL